MFTRLNFNSMSTSGKILFLSAALILFGGAVFFIGTELIWRYIAPTEFDENPDGAFVSQKTINYYFYIYAFSYLVISMPLLRHFRAPNLISFILFIVIFPCYLFLSFVGVIVAWYFLRLVGQV